MDKELLEEDHYDIKFKANKVNCFDSDSGEENSHHSNTDKDSLNKNNHKDEEPSEELNQEIFKSSLKQPKNNLTSIYDSESSEDEREEPFNSETESIHRNENIKLNSNNTRTSEGKMTGREALALRQEIQAESQRMLRERKVSLPYHKPKHHTIKEFLEKRPKLSLPLLENIKNVSPSIALKMTNQQLEVVKNELEKREKVVKEFYKSESDLEDDETDLQIKQQNNNEIEVASAMGDNILEEYNNKGIENIRPEDCPTIELTTSKNTESSKAEPCIKILQMHILKSLEADINIDPVECNNDTNSNTEVKQSKSILKNLLTKYQVLDRLNNRNFNTNLVQHLQSFKPFLTGKPHEEINFTDGIVKPNAVTQLKERFLKHAKKSMCPNSVEIGIINLSQEEIKKEKITMSVDNTEEPIFETPGLKLKMLRNNLQLQMAKKRSELWQQRNQTTDELDNEKTKVENMDLLNDEEEAESTEDDDDEEEDEEMEETHYGVSKNQSTKSEFLYDEAEESEDGNSEYEEEHSISSPYESPSTKKHKRIIKGCVEDSTSDEDLFTSNTDIKQTLSNGEKLETGNDEQSSPLYHVQSNTCFDQEVPIVLPETNINLQNSQSYIEENTELSAGMPITQDLLDICSGAFSGLTNNNKKDFKDEHSVIDNSNQLELENTYLDKDRIVSQLLNEEEMELFKKKFNSPVSCNSKGSLSVPIKGKLHFDSSDEDETKTKETTKQKRLYFSDEESDLEEVDLNSKEELSNSSIIKDVDYDSEENEIINEPSVNLRPADFFENEAELTESDWDSADEDEKDLDVLDAEQGDGDIFDEDQMKVDLERIHMRQVLDQDNHEIKILQELLLEDGELHGNGRQKQFRWLNIGNDEDDDRANNSDVETYFDEQDCEETWRKMRFQRESFLKSKEESKITVEETELDNNESQVLGTKHIFQKNLTIIKPSFENKPPKEVNYKKPVLFANTRGSFLSRNENVLSRLAEFNKPLKDNNGGTGMQKHSKNFVFLPLGDDKKISNTSAIDKRKRKLKGDSSTITKKAKMC